MIRWKAATRRCKAPGCHVRYWQENPRVKWCSEPCCDAIGAAALAKVRAKREAKAKAETREQRKKLETLGQLKNRIQGYCNAYVRERDWGKPCFTCDRPHDGTHKRDAGHFKAIGAGGGSPARYHLNNIRMTCTQCNTKRGGGNHPNYRPRLVAEVGECMVEAVERLHNSTVRWDRSALEQLGAWFRAETNRMKREREQRGMVGSEYQQQHGATEAQIR